MIGPHDFDPSALVHMGDGEPMAALARATDPDFVLVPIASSYHGIYFYTVGSRPPHREKGAS